MEGRGAWRPLDRGRTAAAATAAADGVALRVMTGSAAAASVLHSPRAAEAEPTAVVAVTLLLLLQVLLTPAAGALAPTALPSSSTGN